MPLPQAQISEAFELYGRYIREGRPQELANFIKDWNKEQWHAYGNELFTFAVTVGDPNIINLFLKYVNRPLDINHKSKNEGRSALSLAAEKALREVVQRLLAHGADVNSLPKYTRTPISFAAAKGRADIVRLLAEQDYINGKNAVAKHGGRPSDYAREYGRKNPGKDKEVKQMLKYLEKESLGCCWC